MTKCISRASCGVVITRSPSCVSFQYVFSSCAVDIAAPAGVVGGTGFAHAPRSSTDRISAGVGRMATSWSGRQTVRRGERHEKVEQEERTGVQECLPEDGRAHVQVIRQGPGSRAGPPLVRGGGDIGLVRLGE